MRFGVIVEGTLLNFKFSARRRNGFGFIRVDGPDSTGVFAHTDNHFKDVVLMQGTDPQPRTFGSEQRPKPKDGVRVRLVVMPTDKGPRAKWWALTSGAPLPETAVARDKQTVRPAEPIFEICASGRLFCGSASFEIGMIVLAHGSADRLPSDDGISSILQRLHEQTPFRVQGSWWFERPLEGGDSEECDDPRPGRIKPEVDNVPPDEPEPWERFGGVRAPTARVGFEET